MKQTDLPLAAMERLLRRAGADRVSEDAKEALREVLEEIAVEIGQDANDLAKHAKRTTVRAEDIKLASK
ncbi:histone family protein [Candidatus Woesearchaeota archaeon]|nr:histone family protein [Candidatus Woesearchaeota archaeon]